MSKAREEDIQNTMKLVRKPNPVSKGVTWLRHHIDAECGLIDLMILEGTYTIEMMIDALIDKPKFHKKTRKQWEKRISDHILHLSTEEGDSRNQINGDGGHNLNVSISEETGIVKFDY
ncbi:hypothetical protein [Maribellus sp. YY47]|uniref:hypothetical protein n=1 Tax=Maribellus sp. YY47 TaxID=2929486 RepID=UPI002000CB8A|nr:hypothetical protein [Maribellus sp. YY47]MCK3683978.1 hypothetical protein [Maribellus sp. YY47]